MAKQLLEIPINSETSKEDLHKCIIAAHHSSDGARLNSSTP